MTDKKERIDIHSYLAAFDDIPGTRVFTAKRARHALKATGFFAFPERRSSSTMAGISPASVAIVTRRPGVKKAESRSYVS